MIKFSAVKLFTTSLVAFLAIILLTPSHAQSAPRITEAIDNSALTVLAHTTHPYATPDNDRGRVDSNLPMQRMVLLFKPSGEQAAALRELINKQQDTVSGNYQKWISPEEFASKFGPNDADLKQITSWLTQQGFTVETIARGRQWLEFSGTAAQVENALHTEMHHYLVNGELHIANSADISVPRAITPVVAGVVTLHNFEKHSYLEKMYGVHRDPVSGKLTPDLTVNNSNGTFHFLAPGDYSKIYNTKPLLTSGIDGSGGINRDCRTDRHRTL